MTSHDGPLLSRRFTITASILLSLLFIANCIFLLGPHGLSTLDHEWLPAVSGRTEQRIGGHTWRKAKEPTAHVEVQDEHPIKELMHDADSAFEKYDAGRSRTFKETVERYRREYGRHPPPGFKEWYKFARKHQIHDIDSSFAQIHSDLRPFWSIPPATIRHYAAHAHGDLAHHLPVVHIRGGQIFQKTPKEWRAETFVKMLTSFVQWLPDMDIPINQLDEPRVVVPFEDMQDMLKAEEQSRSLSVEGVADEFTMEMEGFWRPKPIYPEPNWLYKWNPFYFPKQLRNDPEDPHPKYGWFRYAGKPFMDIAAKACPPDSYARNPESSSHRERAEKSYKSSLGGFVTNANLSSDLCTVGPTLAKQHGFLYASVSLLATHKLVPVFSECKTNVNNDILFPANMYWKQDKRYNYNDKQDIGWDDKDDMMPWRGVTSGGLTFRDRPEGWKNMQRQRLVAFTNSTALGDTTAPILILANSDSAQNNKTYSQDRFRPSAFAHQHTDIGFTGKMACIPNCSYYDSVFAMLNKTTFAETFRNKFLIDVDGHSFSGRWRAFLQSRSLGLKATIFREWHDSRLVAWRHYVPVDNRFGELYSLLTYFIGLSTIGKNEEEVVVVERHDYEAHRIAKQGRDWAAKVLRREDIEIYMFRLLLEYGRLIDDSRDRIGFVGDGGREMVEFDRRVPAVD